MSLRCFPSSDIGNIKRWRMVCFPYAGGGATPFATWRRLLPDAVDLHAQVAPGREERAGEPPLRSVEALVADAMPGVDELMEPLVLVGHSFGAWLAFETAHLLVAADRPPAHVVLLAAGPPGRAALPCVTDDQDIEEIWAGLGADTARLSDRRFRSLAFPPLCADLVAQITYRPPQRAPLPAPVTVLYGTKDPSMNREDAAAWQPLCAGACRIVAVSGGHFFPQQNREVTVREIVRLVES
jgi:pyochelin biosynthesis protein PchC